MSTTSSATVRPGDAPITLVNVFIVDPERQESLVAVLTEATETVMRHRDGFVSASIHASTDGTRVANYAQWRKSTDHDAVLEDPVAGEHMRRAAEIADSFDAHLYTVRSVHRA